MRPGLTLSSNWYQQVMVVGLTQTTSPFEWKLSANGFPPARSHADDTSSTPCSTFSLNSSSLNLITVAIDSSCFLGLPSKQRVARVEGFRQVVVVELLEGVHHARVELAVAQNPDLGRGVLRLQRLPVRPPLGEGVECVGERHDAAR